MKTNYVKEAVVVVVGLLLGVLLSHVLTPHQGLGGVVSTTGPEFPGGFTQGGFANNWGGGKIEAKTNTATWRGVPGQTAYVDYVETSTDGTASSSYKIYAVATTSAIRTLYDFVAPTSTEGKMAINNFVIATSSIATTTTAFDKAPAGKTIRVPDGYQLNFYLVNADSGCAAQAGFCEAATSSNRGFNVQWRVHYHL